MVPLLEYILPIKTLRPGTHVFTFKVDDDFFKHFEYSPVKSGEFDVNLVYKRLLDMIELHFSFEGSVQTECDRCTVPIRLPYKGSDTLIVKISLEQLDEDDPDIIFVSPEESHINVAPYLYEYLCLHMPSPRVYACEKENPRPCDMSILKHINYEKDNSEGNTDEIPGNSEWKSQLDNLLSDLDDA